MLELFGPRGAMRVATCWVQQVLPGPAGIQDRGRSESCSVDLESLCPLRVIPA